MTAVDTNVLVRIITSDDKAQAARAAAFLREQDNAFIAKTVLLELEWVLRGAYRIGRGEIASALRGVVEVGNTEIEDETAVLQALRWFETGMDFADALHLASVGRGNAFATFNGRLRRRARRLKIENVVPL
ncbi:MAG: type II toxin-antitoxin system VapC family toxin [Candidatus Binataceae bacterium]